MKVSRRITYKLYPSAKQRKLLRRHLELHRDLYNAALEERIDAERKQNRRITFADQCRAITEIRKFDDEYANLNCHSLQQTLKRLDLGCKASRDRDRSVTQESRTLYIRSIDDYSGWGFNRHKDGFRFEPGIDWINGNLNLTGIGRMKARGRPRRTPTKIIGGDVYRRGEDWFLSLLVETQAERNTGADSCGLDWGVSTFATIVTNADEGGCERVENPRFRRGFGERYEQARKAAAHAKRGSRNHLKKRARLAKLTYRMKRKRHDFLHKTTARLVARFGLIATEDLRIKDMTARKLARSRKNDMSLKAKNTLIDSILDAAPATFLRMLEYKSQEAGGTLVMLSPRQTRASQTCPKCGVIEKKTISVRRHECRLCGHSEDRDAAAARVLLKCALSRRMTEIGREPTEKVEPQTNAISTFEPESAKASALSVRAVHQCIVFEQAPDVCNAAAGGANFTSPEIDPQCRGDEKRIEANASR